MALDTTYGDAQFYTKLVSELNADPDYHLVVSGEEVDSIAAKSEGTLLNMLLLYAPKAIVLTKSETGYEYIDSPIPVDNVPPVVSGTSRLRYLVREEGATNLFFVPEMIATQVEDYQESEQWPSTYLREHFSFAKAYTNRLGLELSLRDPAIAGHVLAWRIPQRLGCASSQVGTLKAWLPNLGNIPLSWLATLRSEEGDSFARFHAALRKLVAKLPSELSSEQRIKELFEEVDYETRTFEVKMQELSSRASLRRREVFVGFTFMALCFAIPSDVAQLVTSALGMYQAKDFAKSLFQLHEEKLRLKGSDFYIPWLCTKSESIDRYAR